jgi:hypothetical protein
MHHYTIDAGRTIVRDSIVVGSFRKVDTNAVSPAEADALARRIVAALNLYELIEPYVKEYDADVSPEHQRSRIAERILDDIGPSASDWPKAPD